MDIYKVTWIQMKQKVKPNKESEKKENLAENEDLEEGFELVDRPVVSA